MSNIFYYCFLICCAAWAFGYYVLDAGTYVHLLLPAAALSIVISIVQHKEPVK